MGDAACVAQGFCQPPAAADREEEENSFLRLEGSISFGRYVSESLDWGRWSSFRQNRYIEEAEKSSKPGSVAQMKAHFEARFKRIAAMKAAAQAEQASSTLAPVGGEEEEEEEASMDPPLVNPQPAPSQIEAAADAMQPEPEAAASSPGKQSFPATESKQEDRRMGEDGDQATIRGSSPKILPPDGETTAEGNGILAEAHAREANGDEENQGDGRISDLAPRRTSQAMKPPLQESSAANREAPASASKGKKQSRFIPSKWPPVFGQAPAASSPSSSTPRNPRKENPPNQSWKRPSKDPVSRYPRAAMETPPPSAARTNPNQISPGRFDSPMNLLRTPTRPPTSGATPQSEGRRTGTPSQPCGKKVNAVSQSVSTSCWRSSSSVWKRPAQVVCSPFRFRSDERAEKRREFFLKLEEKLNAEKLERQSQAKETAENELKKLRQGLGFKARPMPGFYRRTDPPQNEIKKVTPARPQSPKLGRRSDDHPPEASPRSCFPSLRSASLARKCGSPSWGSGNKKDKQLN